MDLGDGKPRIVVGAELQIALTDKSDKPLSGSVTEHNVIEGGGKPTENPKPVDLKNGSFKDWVGPATAKSSLAQVKEAVAGGIEQKSTQTLTIKTAGATYQAEWSRTVTNLDARGKVGDLGVTWTTPVIKQISP